MITDDDVVAVLGPRLRIVRGERQWIVQRCKAGRWSSIATCRSKAGVRIHLKDYLQRRFAGGSETASFAALIDRVDPHGWADFERMPDFIEKGDVA